jgi:hypothetical protein
MNMTPELRSRFLCFHEAYEARRLQMTESQAYGYEMASEPW